MRICRPEVLLAPAPRKEGVARVLRGIRGAINVAQDSKEDILTSTTELVAAVMERNGLDADSIVSIIFTSTEDLTSEFPAVAARRLGLTTVPLLCCRELSVVGAMPRVIRVLMHVDTDGLEPKHVYLRDTPALRDDLADD